LNLPFDKFLSLGGRSEATTKRTNFLAPLIVSTLFHDQR
jgi:hypothetical protein